MFGLGIAEILVILVLALIFIGPKKLPEIAVNLGKGIREFNRARQGIVDSINTVKNDVEEQTKSILDEEVHSEDTSSDHAATAKTDENKDPERRE
ncbi:MAG: twin-arginine translocase subunit TatB [Bacteriovoracaceae bacterium]|nr:twin-arginine translocase subunit TatB [Bacteriovoracaceae bacterium]